MSPINISIDLFVAENGFVMMTCIVLEYYMRYNKLMINGSFDTRAENTNNKSPT